eukprot:9083229-Lingulodinium_polyedra.AAC.1
MLEPNSLDCPQEVVPLVQDRFRPNLFPPSRCRPPVSAFPFPPSRFRPPVSALPFPPECFPPE